jgi:Ca-activated chloride channel family protein
MRPIRTVTIPTFALLLTLLVTTTVWADGIIIPEPPICDPIPCPRPIPIAQLAIEYHHVKVTIEDQIATTQVDQVFRNDNDWQVEGTYIFPIPDGASINEFTLWIDGDPVEGKILTKEEARRTYEDIVRRMRDPALLEYVDQGAVQASIFPIPPGGTRRIQLEYTELLSADHGLIHYRYPLNTEKFSTQPLEEVSISVKAESSVPMRAVYSPSHKISVDRDSDFEFLVGYEDSQVKPDKDFDLFFSISEEDFGLNLLTYRDPLAEDDDGFFLLLAAPSVEVDPLQSIAKDVILVLDRSGSMEGKKFLQAQEALKYVLEHLNSEDRFNIIAFSTGTDSYSSRLRPASEATEADQWVDRLAAQGSTDINLALLEALELATGERPTMIIFLTDGLPTEGVIETDDILDNVREASPDNVRLFSFGVGYDVDTFLLDTLSQENHGATTYVTPDQAIDEIVTGFYGKVNDPVLTNISIDFGDIIYYDAYPDPLPDLFAGSQLVLVGRYKSDGFETIELSGEVNGEEVTFEFPEQRFRGEGGAEFLPRLWATRKIGALLHEIRLKGPEEEIIDQIVRLSIRYGIITPYTSFLVTEPHALGEEAQDSIAQNFFEEAKEAAPMVSGEAAVERAASEGEMFGADIPAPPPAESADIVRIAGLNTFTLVDGVWIDTKFDPNMMETSKVPFLSEDYFSLATSNDSIAAAFALGENVIVVLGGEAYEVVGSDEPGDSIDLSDLPPEGRPEEIDAGSEDSAPAEEEEVSFPLGCPGIALAIGFVIYPALKREKRE